MIILKKGEGKEFDDSNKNNVKPKKKKLSYA